MSPIPLVTAIALVLATLVLANVAFIRSLRRSIALLKKKEHKLSNELEESEANVKRLSEDVVHLSERLVGQQGTMVERILIWEPSKEKLDVYRKEVVGGVIAKLLELLRRLRNIEGASIDSCSICRSVLSTVLLTDCKHLAMCKECFTIQNEHDKKENTTSTCPICRAEVTKAPVFVFRS